MVGIPKSTGCENCRRRKKKCGEEVPGCLACRRAGWRCPGYPKRWKFVKEDLQLALAYRKKNYILEEVDDSAPSDTDAFPCSNPLSKEDSDSNERRTQLRITWSLISPEDPTCSRLCYILEEPSCWATFPIKSHGSFYTMIPARLGNSTALHDAVSCLCSLFMDGLRRPSSASNATLRLYAHSLQSLRRSLNIPQARTTAETICASIILQLCELIMSDKGGRWNHLCQGTKLLIQESGPDRFKAPFERAMLESQRAWFIVQDVSSGQDCFLSQQSWRKLLSPSCPLPVKEPASLVLRAQLCGFLVDMPGLIRQATEIATLMSTCKTELTELGERQQSLVCQIISFKHAFEWWYFTKLRPLRTKSYATHLEDAKAVNASVSGDDDLLTAVVDCVANSAIIRLDLLLLGLSTTSQGIRVESAVYHETISGRREVMFKFLDYVRSRSSVAAKPLEFGLQQLWLDTRFESGIESPSPKLFLERAPYDICAAP